MREAIEVQPFVANRPEKCCSIVGESKGYASGGKQAQVAAAVWYLNKTGHGSKNGPLPQEMNVMSFINHGV